MKSKFTFSSEVFESCANKFVRYLLETLPVATYFNIEPVVFLIEVISCFSNIWAILRKLSTIKQAFSLKRVSDLVLSSEFFKAFFNRNSPISNKNSLKMRNDKKFDTLRSILRHFQPIPANISLKAYWIMSLVFLNFCQHSDSKTIQKVHKLHKNQNVEYF